MEIIDLRTAVLIAGLMSGLMACVLYSAYLSFPKSVGGLLAWTIGDIFMLLAALGFSLRDKIPDLLSITGANLCFVLGYWFMWSATRELLGLPLPSRKKFTVLFGLAAGLLLFWTYVAPNFAARTILFAGIACTYYLVQSVTVWRRPRRSVVDIIFVLLMLMAFGTTLARVVAGALMANSTAAPVEFLTPTLVQSLYLTAFSVLSLLHSIAFFLMATRKLQIELLQMARHDPLTGVFNRRAMMEKVEVEVANTRRKGLSLSVIMLDLDKFKEVNDTWGHDMGDRVLCDFAGLVGTQKRPMDIFARLGGEEFALVLPDTEAPQALAMAQRIHARLNAVRGGDLPAYTCSLGVATAEAKRFAGTESATSLASLMQSADEAVYAAKRNGRNRIEVAPA